MPPRRRRTAPADDVPLLKRFALVVRLASAVVVVAVLMLVFQLLPQPEQGRQTLAQVTIDTLFRPLSRAAPHMPAWVPLWSIPEIGVVDERLPSAAALEAASTRLVPVLKELRQTSFFRFLKTDIDTHCEFWHTQRLCSDSKNACGVDAAARGAIPPRLLEEAKSFYSASGSQSIPRNPLLKATDVVDLAALDGGYTSFKGRNIWHAIYADNCLEASAPSPVKTSQTICTEEESFFKLLSGMQSAIMVTSADNKHAGNPIKKHSFSLFRYGFASNVGWMENFYFALGTLVETVCANTDLLNGLSCDTGSGDDARSRSALTTVLRELSSACDRSTTGAPAIFVNRQEDALGRLANVTKLMDCIECDKCRVQGKMKAAALGVSIKTLGATKTESLEREEIVSLLNSLLYYAEAAVVVKKFRRRLLSLRALWLLSTASVVYVVFSGRRKLKSD